MAAYKCPRVFQFRSELPKNALGKVLKDEGPQLRGVVVTASDATTPAGAPMRPPRREVPRLDDDYSTTAARQRMAFLAGTAGVAPEHIGRYSFDSAVLAGNIENLIGVASVPVGVAGPLLVDGEHARGTFYVPLATTEGTLVASYNRGMKLLH